MNFYDGRESIRRFRHRQNDLPGVGAFMSGLKTMEMPLCIVIKQGTTWDAALSCPTTRNSDMFGYNERGEVVFSRRDAENAEDTYAYDGIGNLLLSACNAATNTYTANNINQ